MPKSVTARERAAVHEAGHAIAGTLIYGPGFVTKIRMTRGDPRTMTRVDEMVNDPQRIWLSGGLVAVSEPDALDVAGALGVFCLAGMAADWP